MKKNERVKKKAYTLVFDVDITWVGKNPWQQRQNLCDLVKQKLESEFELAYKIEVSVAEMQHSMVVDEKREK